MHLVEQITFHLLGRYPGIRRDSPIATVPQQVDLHSEVSLSGVMLGPRARCYSRCIVLGYGSRSGEGKTRMASAGPSHTA